MAMSADLGEVLEAFVARLLSSRRYRSKSEVLREGVRLIQEREAKLAVLDASIARGLADADAGRVSPSSKFLTSSKRNSRLKKIARRKIGDRYPHR